MTESKPAYGLAALGRYGSVQIELDEPVGHSGPWQLQISGNGWECVFNVSNADAVRDFSVFVKQHANRKIFVEHRVGSFQAADVVVVKDSEFADRFWFRISGARQMVELTFRDENAVALEKALDDLVSDLSK